MVSSFAKYSTTAFNILTRPVLDKDGVRAETAEHDGRKCFRPSNCFARRELHADSSHARTWSSQISFQMSFLMSSYRFEDPNIADQNRGPQDLVVAKQILGLSTAPFSTCAVKLRSSDEHLLCCILGNEILSQRGTRPYACLFPYAALLSADGTDRGPLGFRQSRHKFSSL